VTQRDPVMGLPGQFGWCFLSDLSAVVAGAGLAAVAVLIRSLSTLAGCDSSQSCRCSSLPGRHKQFSAPLAEGT